MVISTCAYVVVKTFWSCDGYRSNVVTQDICHKARKSGRGSRNTVQTVMHATFLWATSVTCGNVHAIMNALALSKGGRSGKGQKNDLKPGFMPEEESKFDTRTPMKSETWHQPWLAYLFSELRFRKVESVGQKSTSSSRLSLPWESKVTHSINTDRVSVPAWH